ncbi:bifunctional DNA-formamidopyrimidine glycosylase/DNA-(apurinic or apyrimidinic site) lyase [Selenomonas sp. ND2010]|uniref:bifunctional DNA-formamidopyrimidine glycosylase/DNA-(apurinic or apyrimidinic site) lyase n=1 Tax=Selenomonas sp. ND2010 TaxID=1410618 RepID=UPI00051B051B|nr:bifunctional DNA-formamidopyrimidine glycosylase/DNA-(apurinic or apyrimidinic site) lyase [Selenomonas sp. ND2010]
MPEMPEVEIICRYLDTVLTGQKIMKIDLLLPRQIKWPEPEAYRAMAIGRTIQAMKRRGKYLIMELDNGNELIFHLRMTGRLVFEPEGESHDSYARLLFHLDGGGLLVYGDTRTLGAVYALAPGERWRIHGLAEMGPEPLSPEFTPEYLYQLVQGKKTLIKSLLLNQKYIGGIGNIYDDEALFLAGIHPQRRAGTLTQEECQRLYGTINSVIEAGIRDGGTTFRDYQNGEGRQGSHQEHLFVYNRKGQPCRKCGTSIEKITVGGRGTHYCPHCQK